jgi:hypothetical protein
VTRPVVRTAVLALIVTALAAGCARPGELGHENDAAPPPPPAAGAPGPPPAQPAPPVPAAAAGSDARGTLDAPVDIRTPGAAEFLVRTETLAPGQSSGWITHPGAVISVVRSGTVTVVQRDACTPAPVGAERSFYVADAAPYEMRNDGPDPVVLTRSELLAPGADERRPAAPAC